MNKMKATAIIIVLLSAFDALATSVGVTQGYIEEGNPVINAAMTMSPHIDIKTICLIAFIVTIGLTCFVYKHSYKYSWVKLCMKGILAVKSVVAMMHIYWIGVIIYLGNA